MFQKLADHYRQRRFAYLFFSLLFTIVAAPLLGALGWDTRFLEIFLGFNILAAAVITLVDFGSFAGLATMVVVFAVRGAHDWFDYHPFLATSHGGSVAICLFSGFTILRHVLREGKVTGERIFAALDVYLLLGITCGLLFCVFEELWPQSFFFQGTSFAENQDSTLAHTIYFSFVTLGTLGYGDVIPISGLARALAIVEAMCGQMYLVVVVARLVSLYQGKSGRDDDGAPPPDTAHPV
ncbi:MAG: potassium channel family protein [Syntrophobacteraceae bacterium]|nr:potassium channel family protein [Desulfobacteraceae bacterium]